MIASTLAPLDPYVAHGLQCRQGPLLVSRLFVSALISWPPTLARSPSKKGSQFKGNINKPLPYDELMARFDEVQVSGTPGRAPAWWVVFAPTVSFLHPPRSRLDRVSTPVSARQNTPSSETQTRHPPGPRRPHGPRGRDCRVFKKTGPKCHFKRPLTTLIKRRFTGSQTRSAAPCPGS